MLVSKLKEPGVLAIRQRYQEGVAAVDLAIEYGVHLRTIFRVLSRATWAHI